MDRGTLIDDLRARICEIEQGAPGVSDEPCEDVGTSSRLSASDSSPSQCRHAETDPTAHNATDGEDEEARAFAKIVRSASVREQSSSRIRDKLVHAGFAESASEAALAKAVRLGVIDDRRYAELLVRSAVAKGRGLERVRREIEDLGIDMESLDAYADYCEGEGARELDRALVLLRARPTRARNKRAAAYRKLMTSGFPSDVASEASRIWSEEISEAASAGNL